MSTNSKCSSLSWAAGALLVAGLAGLATLTWLMLARAAGSSEDPMSEVDRRIDSLEHSLQRLHDTFDQAVRR
jgi:hypothetical protein